MQLPPLNVQKYIQKYKEICHYQSVPPSARIEEIPYLCSYRYPPALAYKHQLPFRLVNIHSTGDSNVAEMQLLLFDTELRRNATDLIT